MATLACADAGRNRIAAELHEQGYCIVREALPPAIVAELDDDLARHFARTPFGEGAFYGTTTKRFGRLLVRSRHADALVRQPRLLAAVEAVLGPWCDCIQLNTTQAIAIHPGAPAQLPHRDQKRGSHASAPSQRRDDRLTNYSEYATGSVRQLCWP